MKKEIQQKQVIIKPVQVTICGWLFVLESVIFFVVGVYHFHLNDGPALFSRLFGQWIRRQMPVNVDTVQRFIERLLVNAYSGMFLEALIESAVMFVLTILALWTAVGFFRSWKIAWTSGLSVQIINLVTALVLYFAIQPFHIIFMFVPGIFIVFYLNYADVHDYFNGQNNTLQEQ